MIIGLLGGSFDPVHNGHLALAQAACDQLKLDEVRLIPAAQPWQRTPLIATAEQRLTMLKLAIAKCPALKIDTREIIRGGLTYTDETLKSLRQELGPQAVLVWIVGSDQLHNLPSWRNFDQLFAFAHFAVAQRADTEPIRIPEQLVSLSYIAQDTRWRLRSTGALLQFTMPAVPISSTQIRRLLGQQLNPQGLVPADVFNYIKIQKLYGYH